MGPKRPAAIAPVVAKAIMHCLSFSGQVVVCPDSIKDAGRCPQRYPKSDDGNVAGVLHMKHGISYPMPSVHTCKPLTWFMLTQHSLHAT